MRNLIFFFILQVVAAHALALEYHLVDRQRTRFDIVLDDNLTRIHSLIITFDGMKPRDFTKTSKLLRYEWEYNAEGYSQDRSVPFSIVVPDCIKIYQSMECLIQPENSMYYLFRPQRELFDSISKQHENSYRLVPVKK